MNNPCYFCGSAEANERLLITTDTKKRYRILLAEVCKDCKIAKENKTCLRCRRKYAESRLCIEGVCDRCTRSIKGQVKTANTRAKTAGVEATLTLDEWLKTLSDFRWACVYCGGYKDLIVEHYVALYKGGDTSSQNCIPACSLCNSKKGWREQRFNKFKIAPETAQSIEAYLASR